MKNLKLLSSFYKDLSKRGKLIFAFSILVGAIVILEVLG